MELLAPWSLAGLVLVPAIFLWGLLAPRGRPVVVGSLMLWRRVLGKGTAGKPSARARLKDPLVWLDALTVLLIVLACAQPAVRTAAPAQAVATLVLDRTASMGTQTGTKNRTRWRDAEALVASALKEAGDGPIRMVSVPDGSGVVTTTETTVADALARLGSAMEPVLAAVGIWPVVLAEAARAVDRPVVVATDVAPAGDLPANVYVLATGGESADVGIERVGTRIEANRWWLLARARAAPRASGPYSLEVSAGGSVLAAKAGFLAPGAAAEAVLPVDGPPPAQLRVELKGPDDAFPPNNVAVLAMEPAGTVRVLVVGEADPSVRRALEARAGTVVAESAAASAVAADDPDLVVTVGVPLPADWKGPAVALAPAEAVGPVRPEEGNAKAEWRVAEGHPLAGALYLEAPRVGPLRRWRLDSGARLLLGTPDVPLMATWEEDGQRRLAVLFAFDDKVTDWPRRAGFPVFWSRGVDWLVPRQGAGAAHRTHLPFEPIPGRGRAAPATPGFHPDEAGGIGVSFVGTDEGFQAGPGRNDSRAAVGAIRASIEARRRAGVAPAWPYVAAAALVALVLRAWVAR
jgi:hypothetical protein